MASPSDFPEVKAWYQVDQATITSTRVTSLPDTLGGPPFVTNLSAPGPVQDTTANGLKVMTWTGAECLVAPDATPAWQNSSWFGLAFWFKPTAETGQGDFFNYWSGTLGLSGNRIICRTSANTRIAQIVRNAADNGSCTTESNTGSGLFVFKTGVWQFHAFTVDCRLGTVADRSNILIGGAPLPLPQFKTDSAAMDASMRTTATAPNLVTLGARDVDQGTSAVSGGVIGQMGPDIFFFDPALKAGKLRHMMNRRVPRG